MYNEQYRNIHNLVRESWNAIAPFWPLKNLIAVNPLQGFEHLPIEKAMSQGAVFFEQKNLPQSMELINRQTIKWAQAFFDEGQAVISMPLRVHGLYHSWKKLIFFDDQIHNFDHQKKQWILQLPKSSEQAIVACFLKLKIREEQQLIFMTLMLTTLPGWASYIAYLSDWKKEERLHSDTSLQVDYIAVRLIMMTLLWEDGAEDLIAWHEKLKESESINISIMQNIQKAEKKYLDALLPALTLQKVDTQIASQVQILFCIDVRSESFRKVLEAQGNYETFGCAGFFGVPVSIKNSTTQELYTSCPVLLQPDHIVTESPCFGKSCNQDSEGYQNLRMFKSLYQSLKYNIATAFALVDLVGFGVAVWMALKNFAPRQAYKLRDFMAAIFRPYTYFIPSLESISFADQCVYAESALRIIGLTKNFSSLVVFCGHGSSSQNNAYASILDCGACGGRHGASNAKIIVKILNTQKVREHLKSIGIVIPDATCFIAAEHNTTTDEIEMYTADIDDIALLDTIKKLKIDCINAGKIHSQFRSKNMGLEVDQDNSLQATKLLSLDWAQVRPEWGLARNASFIVAPRAISKKIDLEGRAFLHSYDYSKDLDGAILTTILTAPMVVAQWINSQYLFSALDNIAYGSGSKITHNITGKIGVMQGNASDLMTGLPLQSIYKTDTELYHEPLRLMTIVYAPLSLIDKVIQNQPILKKLFGNGWVICICINPENNDQYFLDRDLTWKKELFYE